jgi:hypothetical protein
MEKIADQSLPQGDYTIPDPLLSSQQVLSRLAEQLRSIINVSTYETCATKGAGMCDTGSQRLIRDKPPVLPDRVLEILDTPPKKSIKISVSNK